MPTAPTPLPAELTLVRLADPLVESLGLGPDDPYVDLAVLPVVGPSGTIMWRRMAKMVAAGQCPLRVDTAELLRCLGLSASLARNSPGGRTIYRIDRFGLVRRFGSRLAVRTALAPWSERRAGGLPAPVKAYHDQVVREHARISGAMLDCGPGLGEEVMDLVSKASA
jgi:hypothetical protein